jgi:hypothetical protein
MLSMSKHCRRAGGNVILDPEGIQSIVMPATARASPFYIGTNEFFVYSVIAVYKWTMQEFNKRVA